MNRCNDNDIDAFSFSSSPSSSPSSFLFSFKCDVSCDVPVKGGHCILRGDIRKVVVKEIWNSAPGIQPLPRPVSRDRQVISR